jgi:hypothetical protein
MLLRSTAEVVGCSLIRDYSVSKLPSVKRRRIFDSDSREVASTCRLPLLGPV